MASPTRLTADRVVHVHDDEEQDIAAFREAGLRIGSASSDRRASPRHGLRATPRPPVTPSSHRPSSAATEKVIRAPSGALLRRQAYLPWAPVAQLLRSEDEAVVDATVQRLGGLYPASPVPRSGRFSPNGGFYVAANLDDDVAVRPSIIMASPRSPDSATAAVSSSADSGLAAAVRETLRVLFAEARAEGTKRGDPWGDEDANGGAAPHGVPEWLRVEDAEGFIDGADGEPGSFDAATISVWVDVHAAFPRDPGAFDVTNQGTRALLKRIVAGVPESQTKLLANFFRLWADRETIVDARIQFFYSRSREALRDSMRAVLRGALATGVGISRHGERGQWLCCHASSSLAAFVYAFIASHLREASPLRALDPGLFHAESGGAGLRALPTPTELLRLTSANTGATSSSSTGAARRGQSALGSSTLRGAAGSTSGVWLADGMFTGVAGGSGRRNSGAFAGSSPLTRAAAAASNAAAPACDSLRHAVRHRARCFTADVLPWYCDRELTKPIAGVYTAAIGEWRRRRDVAARSADAEAAARAVQDELRRYDYDGRRADLDTFAMPEGPDWASLAATSTDERP